jgi:hypothetical protein
MSACSDLTSLSRKPAVSANRKHANSKVAKPMTACFFRCDGLKIPETTERVLVGRKTHLLRFLRFLSRLCSILLLPNILLHVE